MKQYRLHRNKIKDYTKRQDNRVFKMLLVAMLLMTLLMLPMILLDEMYRAMAWMFVVSLVFTNLVVFLIYRNNQKLGLLGAKNLLVTIDDTSITRIIDLDNEPRMNFLHKYAYQNAKQISGAYYAQIAFKDLKSVETKKEDLWLKSTKSNSFNGKNMIVIPTELEGFEEIEKILKAKLK